MNEPTAAEYVDMPVGITREGIYIGDHKIPGCIKDGGVTFQYGCDKDINRLTVVFLVGELHADDAMLEAESQ